MKCENCGKNQANVKYTQIINGDKKQMFLCEKCSKELGIENINFDMPIDFSSFLVDFFNDMYKTSFIPSFSSQAQLKCKQCGLEFDDFLHTGNFGCNSCYDEFESVVDPILKNNIPNDDKISQGKSEIDDLKEELKKAIKDERYEDAAKLRDKIKKIEK